MSQTPEILKTYLQNIEETFPEYKTSQPIHQKDIQAYYAASFWGYTLFHSWAGAVHMALSPSGALSTRDYSRQAEEVATLISGSEHQNMRIVEVGCGKGFNLIHLARQFPDIRVEGIDLTQKHITSAIKRLRNYPNASAIRDDFQHLTTQPDAATDLVFAVETLCHATALPQALTAIARTLKSGGHLVVYDAFRDPGKINSKDITKAARYTERAMAVSQFHTMEDFLNAAQKAGFICTLQEDRTSDILPNLNRLFRMAESFFNSTRRKKILLSLLPRNLVANSIAGLLMPTTFQSGAFRYMKLIFQKTT